MAQAPQKTPAGTRPQAGAKDKAKAKAKPRPPGARKNRGASAAARGPDAHHSRALWRGAISFGLVHIPIGLHSATASSGIDFDWLDRRTMEPVGYKRVNKASGKEVTAKDIVKGVPVGQGRYVVLSNEEIAAAFPKTTQTIEIEAFVDADEVPFVYLERPYYTVPLERGAKVYALLREALRRSHKVAVAKVVIQTQQHLAVLIPCGRALVLDLLRWGGEIRSVEELGLPPAGAEAAGIREAEMQMALQLIDDMAQPWDADQFRNSFADEIHRLVAAKVEAGDTAAVPRLPGSGAREPPRAAAGADVLDLAALLQRSLSSRQTPAPRSGPAAPVTPLPRSRAPAPGPALAGSAAKPAKPGAAPGSKPAAAAKKPRAAPAKPVAARKSAPARPPTPKGAASAKPARRAA